MEVQETSDSAQRSHAWIGRAIFEAALIVLGLVGAFVVDEWRDSRERAERVRAALESIRAELAVNVRAVEAAIDHHENVMARLRAAAKSGETYGGGIMVGQPFSSVAWEAARDAGTTNEIDLPTLMTLGRAYRSLDFYLNARQVLLDHVYTPPPTSGKTHLGSPGG